MRKAIILTLLALAVSYSNASGTAACKLSIPLEVKCFVEQILFSVHNLEIAGGVELTTSPFTFTPYTAIAWYEQDWFTVLEVATEVTTSTRFTMNLTFGVHW